VRPLLLDQCCDPAFPVVPGAPWGACRGCPIWPTETILPSPAVTRRPPGAKFLCRDARRSLSLRVNLEILIVASSRIRKYWPTGIRLPTRVLHSPARIQRTRSAGCVRAYTWRGQARPRPWPPVDRGAELGRPPGTVGSTERRDRLEDAEIRGVSHNCRIVTYQNAAEMAVKITTSSLL
jgi:hypothetical protein